VAWEVNNELLILVRTSATEDVDQMAEIFAASQTGTPWALLINKSGTKKKAPIFNSFAGGAVSVEIDDLPGFMNHEFENGRYYPIGGKSWKWYYGRSTDDGNEGDSRYGEYVDDPSKMKYVIVVEGDLSYIEDNSFSIYLTTGRSYDIKNYVTSIASLQTFITYGSYAEFRLDVDYTFRNQILEFKKDPLEDTLVNGSYLYHPKTPIIEHMLFELYGNMVNISDWLAYNYDNISGKAGINSLMNSLQNSSNREDYERALNIYYGLPIAPETCSVVGLYESYGYKILDITDDQITLDTQSEPILEDLSPFIQSGGRFITPGKREVIISGIVSRYPGVITIEDASELAVGDLLYIKLTNRYLIKSIYAETESTPAYIDIYSNNGYEPISHIIDLINSMSDGVKYPEIIIYGTSEFNVNYDGIYHITSAESMPSSVVRLSIYKKPLDGDPLYNDFIGATTETIDYGYVHIPWPTHKFLYLLLGGERYFKAYLDAPIDTIYEDGDKLTKYQTIARNVSVLNKVMFPNWYQFDNFRRYNGLNYESDILELTKSTIGAEFGNYFPSRYKEIA
jgi:hypothetical protein